MKKVILGVIAVLTLIFAVPCTHVHAEEEETASEIDLETNDYDDMIGSISTAEDVDEKVKAKAAKLIDETDVDTLFEKEYKNTSWKDGYTKEDLRLLSALIFCEANGMSFEAQVGVGNVVLNRVRSSEWGHVNTIKEVIYDRKWGVQFSPTSGNPSYMDKTLKIYDSMDPSKFKAWEVPTMEKCIEAAKAVLRGLKTVPDSYIYFNSHMQTTPPKCERNGWSYTIINGHIYYAQKSR